MCKLLKHILLRTVLVIIMLHTVLIHPNSKELSVKRDIEFHQNSNSLFGKIKLAFHKSTDHSLDNLIIDSNATKTTIDAIKCIPLFSIFTISNTEIIFLEKETYKNSNSSTLSNLIFVKLNPLRGPPSQTA